MGLVGRAFAALAAVPLILGLAVPAVATAATLRDCSGRTIEAGADLRRCDLAGAVIIGLDLHDIDLSRANLQDVNGGCDPDLPRTNLFEARLSGADARRALLCDAILAGANLRGADLGEASLEDADLRSIDGRGLRLDMAGVQFAVLVDADLANASMRSISAIGATFDAADLRDVDARDGDFRAARMVDADLRGAHLDRVDFTMANLTGARLDRASGLASVTWSATICPDGTNSDANGGTCVGHLV
jgi:uncharacterized protein YjbI with pentapeptide repeats